MKPYYFVFIPALLLTSCGNEPEPHAAVAQTPPVAVQVAAVAAQEWPVTYTATGTVRARTTGTVFSKLMAYVQQVTVQVGDHVREGQTLITLDTRDLDSNVRRAEAGLAEAQSALPELENAAAAAKVNVDLAQSTFKRMEELSAKKSISSQEFDEASARLRTAQAHYETVRSRRGQITARAEVAEQEMRAARIQREYAKIAAPFSGVVTTRSVEPGNLASPGTPLLAIEREGVYRLEAAVDESQLAGVRVGQTVEVAFDGQEARIPARVSEVVPTVDAASRSYIVKIDLPATAKVRSGMFGRAFFPMGKQNVASVPAAALLERGQMQSVFVVEDGVAHARIITTGARSSAGVEILSGLRAGEKVVSPALADLKDGARVEVRQ